MFSVNSWHLKWHMDASNLPLPGKFWEFLNWSFDFCQCMYLNVACGVACESVCVCPWKTKFLESTFVKEAQCRKISGLLCCFNIRSVAAMNLSRIFLSIRVPFVACIWHNQVVLSMTTTVTTLMAGADMRVFWHSVGSPPTSGQSERLLNLQESRFVGGGNSNICWENWGRCACGDEYFSDGLVKKPPTRNVFLIKFIVILTTVLVTNWITCDHYGRLWDHLHQSTSGFLHLHLLLCWKLPCNVTGLHEF